MQLRAWTIKPPMTAMLMGAGYIAGACFFWRIWHATQWHTAWPLRPGDQAGGG